MKPKVGVRFRSPLLNFALCKTDVCLDIVEEYFDLYESVLQCLANQFAPVKRIKIRLQQLEPRMDNECQ